MQKAIGSLLITLSSLAYGASIYDFTGRAAGVSVNPLTFALTVTAPLTADAVFTPGAELVCNACTQVEFYVDAISKGLADDPSQAIGYQVGGKGTYFFYFPVGSFTTDGVYSTILLKGVNDGVLTVSGASTGEVPEPATLSVMLTGLAGLLVAARRRRSIGW